MSEFKGFPADFFAFFEELATLGESAGVRQVQILDSSTGAQVNRIDYP